MLSSVFVFAQLKNAAQAVSLMQQVACALAVAEEVLSFEHRDLHMGNILVQSTRHTTVTVTLNNTPIFIDTQGIHVSIIDFTLSRLTKGRWYVVVIIVFFVVMLA